MKYTSAHWFMLIMLSVVWGFSFIFMKYGLKTFSWDQVAALRISFSFVFTLPLFVWHFNKIKRAEIKYYCAVGFFGSGLPAFCFTFAQTHIDSGITGVLNSLTPVFTFLIGVMLFGMRFERMKFYGLLIALTGAVLLVLFDTSEGGESNILYALPLFLATMSYAMSANIVKKYLQSAHPLALGAVGFMFIGIPAILYLFSTDFVDRATIETFRLSFTSIMALSFFGTVLASIGYYMLIQKTDPIFGSLVAYIIPVVAIIAGAADGESLKAYHLAGMVFILAGIWVINKRGAGGDRDSEIVNRKS